MKKIIFSIMALLLLITGAATLNNTTFENNKNIAAGGEREPSVLSISSFSARL